MTIYDILFIDSVAIIAILFSLAMLTRNPFWWGREVGIILAVATLYWFFYVSFAATRFTYHFSQWLSN
jgi:uncharacterized membrane protein